MSLRKWVAEKWVDIGAKRKDGSYAPCGRSKGEKRKGYPKCVPLAKARSMSEGQRRSAVARKRAAGNTGPKPKNVATFAKRKKAAEWWYYKYDNYEIYLMETFQRGREIGNLAKRKKLKKDYLEDRRCSTCIKRCLKFQRRSRQEEKNQLKKKKIY
jgi:hypothetical protein